MAGHTLSAYTDEQTYKAVTDLARREDRSTAQIVAAALRHYLRLPESARNAIRKFEADGPQAADEAAWAAGRALLNKQFEDAMAAVAHSGKALVPPGATEEEILAKAVEITRRRPSA